METDKDLTLVEQTILDFKDSLDILSELILEYTFDKDRELEEVAKLWYDIIEIREGIGISVATLEDLMGKLMAVREVLSLPDQGVTVEKVKAQSRVKWDHNTLKSVVSEKILETHMDEDGVFDKEIPLARLIEEAFEYTGLQWKVTKLRELELSPDKYSVKKDGNISYRLSRSAHAEEVKEEDDDFI